MNRIQSPRRFDDAPRYCRKNPPPNEEVALEKIDVLHENIALIEAELEHKEVESFPNEGAYEDWRRRAIGALGYSNGELQFLVHWLGKSKAQHNAPGRTGENVRLARIVGQIRERAQVLADEIERDYTPVYSENTLPANLSDANRRAAQLGAIRQRLQAAFAEITASWTEYPLRRDDLPGTKAALVRVLSRVEVEQAVVRYFIRDVVSNTTWHSVCLAALTRAVAEGFVLTAEERAVMERLRAGAAQRSIA